MTADRAYLLCREIARREAKNFYYAFRVLPRHKSDAMCAVYAFMRKADDLADDESVSKEERRQRMDLWIEEWRTGQGEDPIFVALRDAQQRFGIPNELLEQLVQGTAMDLKPVSIENFGYQTYQNFDQLYRYCYLVASVVGLVCIKIFGYTDIRAEKLAEETGIAFQLTNILRDIREDVERQRIYLPLDTMYRYGVSLPRIQELTKGSSLRANDRAMIVALASTAEQYYNSAEELLPLVEADSRAALWVLVSIYHDLLRRILNQDGDVFSGRISVPKARKSWILARGVIKAVVYRICK